MATLSAGASTAKATEEVVATEVEVVLDKKFWMQAALLPFTRFTIMRTSWAYALTAASTLLHLSSDGAKQTHRQRLEGSMLYLQSSVTLHGLSVLLRIFQPLLWGLERHPDGPDKPIFPVGQPGR